MEFPIWEQMPRILFICACLWAALKLLKIYFKESLEKDKEANDVQIVYSFFNIKQAAMCINCETVFSRNNYRQCPVCASESTYIVGLALHSNEVPEHILKQIKKEGVTIQ